ncbi:MAG: carboxypeptidase [Candidatus Eremiobacteraeota bacterium]|nr:carboxypeptidase [Candidatus Eremiobacteraeota bacterium]
MDLRREWGRTMAYPRSSEDVYNDLRTIVDDWNANTQFKMPCYHQRLPYRWKGKKERTYFFQLPKRPVSSQQHQRSDQLGILLTGGVLGNELQGPDIIVEFVRRYLDALVPHVLTIGTATPQPPNAIVIGNFLLSGPQVEEIFYTQTIFIIPLVNRHGRDVAINEVAMAGLGLDSEHGRKNINRVCIARNFGVAWDYRKLFTAAGQQSLDLVSDDVNDANYHGKRPFSEVETRNFRWMLDYDYNITICFDIHGASVFPNVFSIEYPWNFEEIQTVDPNMCYCNPRSMGKLDGYQAGAKVGVSPTPPDYAEYMPATSWNQGGFSHVDIAEKFKRSAELGDKTKRDLWTIRQAAEMWHCTGPNDDYAFSLDRDRMRAFTVECADLQPPLPLYQHEEEIVQAGLFGALDFIKDAIKAQGKITDLVRHNPPNICH